MGVLQQHGYIEVTSSPDDEGMISLSAAGADFHAQMERKWDVWLNNNPDMKTALANIRTGVRTMQATLATR